VQALLDCLSDAGFNLQVCICSVGRLNHKQAMPLLKFLISSCLAQYHDGIMLPAELAGSVTLPCCFCQVAWAAQS
jgi:hypothetical protein